MRETLFSSGSFRMVSALILSLPHFAFAARTYYVNPDPSLASDDYDGTSATWAGGESKTGPKLTLQGAMNIPSLTSGDTVSAAAGVYDRGGVLINNVGSNRVEVKGGVMLIGAGADGSVIKGCSGDGENGIGPGAMRAVYLRQYAVIQGFTITGGRTAGTSNTEANRGGGIAGAGGLAADCVLTGNHAGQRGGAVAGGNTLLRCYIGDNTAGENYGVYNNTRMVDCVYDCAIAPYSGISAYNCLFKRSVPQGGSTSYAKVYNSIIISELGWYTELNNCRMKGKRRSNETTADAYTRDNIADLAAMYDSQTYRPLADSELIDAGKDDYYALATNNWPAAWLSFAGRDFAGRVRKAGSSIDIGPGEYAWIDGLDSGLSARIEDLGDGTSKVVIDRNFDSEKLCTGFEFGNFCVEFDKNGLGGSWTNIMPSVSVFDRHISALYAFGPAHWYVNCDPLKGNDANRGYHRDCPFFTLTNAASRAVAGDVIHAAKGVYREGDKLSGETRTRVTLPAGVGLVSDCGAEETVIEGVLSGEPGRSGPDSVRCVALGTGAYVKGFTIRNGSTRVGANNVYGENGGGVAGNGAVIDCIITNCYGVRGGGVYQSTLIRCRLSDCFCAAGATNASGVAASVAGDGMHQGRVFDSYVASGLFNVDEVRNSYCSNVWHNNDQGGYTRVYNSYVVSDYDSVAYTNSVLAAGRRKECVFDDKTLSGTTLAFDGFMRPSSAQSVAVDAGDPVYYVYPQEYAHEAGSDLFGGQRVYNGTIDIGPGEFDYRGIFAKKLCRRGVEVEAASPAVVAGDGAGLSLGDGESLTLAIFFRADGECSFRVDGAEQVTVTADGAVLSPAGGVYSFSGNADDVCTVTIVSNGGDALVRDFLVPGPGLVVRVR